MKYSLSQIAEICGGRLLGEGSLELTSVVTDSRSCSFGQGALFVAHRGANHDSHRFIGAMSERGVKGFLVEDESAVPDSRLGSGYVVVRSSIEALQRLAAHHRRQFKGRVLAITGSNGKTTVKEWLWQVAPQGVKVFRSPKSYNSQLGVALSLLMLSGDEDLAIIEAGISQNGEMERLERMIQPDIVVVTSIGDAHQENFDTLDQKIAQKLILARAAGVLIYHSAYKEIAAAVATSDYGGRVVDAATFCGAAMSGEASVRNTQIVAACAAEVGFPTPDFSLLQPLAMRLEVKEGVANSVLVNDSYNSDINSLSIALDYLKGISASRPMVLVLSDILQSGMAEEQLYERVAEIVGCSGVARMIGVGAKIAKYGHLFGCKATFFATTDEALLKLSDSDVADCAVLIKGNRDCRFERISHKFAKQSHTTVLRIDMDAMVSNLNYFRQKLGSGMKMVAMVKASSYGAGNFEVAQMLQNQGLTYLAVAFADEGVLLREKGVSMPIMVLNADSDSFDVMIANRLEPEIYNLRSLDGFLREVKRAGEVDYPIHIKLDTGMHRLGFTADQIDALLVRLGECRPELRVASIFTHFSVADDPREDDFTRMQIAAYDAMSSRIKASVGYPVLRHAANSAAQERFPEARFDMCRLGLGLYGLGYEHNPLLQPVSTLETRIVQIKHLAEGESVGYGRAAVLTRPSVTATIPIGYADGLDRHLGCGKWSMMVRGQKAPILGRVCMDSCMIDITGIDGVSEGDTVTVFSPVEGNDLESMARVLDTIPYEIMTSISVRVRRLYSKE